MMRALFVLAASLPCWGAEALVELADSRVRAADLATAIADWAPPDPAYDLGPAPAPGVRRRVTRAQLVRWTRQAGSPLAAELLPAEVTLVRKLRPWGQEEATELLTDLLAEATGESVSVELERFTATQIPAGGLKWSLLGNPRSSSGPVRVSLVWRDPGGRSGVESVTVAVKASVQALVARTHLAQGAEVGREDFDLATIENADLDKRYLAFLERDQILVLKHLLKAGEPLVAGFVEERSAVERGALIQLLVRVGAVQLRAPARAEGSGSAGELVPFRNLETNQRVIARVTNSKTAEVIAR